MQFRAVEFWARRADEIVASRVEPSIKTTSDLLQDALVMFIEDWDKRYPDGMGGELAYQTRLLLAELKDEAREAFIEQSESRLDRLQANGDLRGLNEFLQIMHQAEGDFKDDAPRSYLVKIEDMIEKAHRLLHAARQLSE
jgi:hypothetical protein